MTHRTFVAASTAALTLLLSGCFGANEDAKVRGEFLKGCMSSGLQKEDCSCAYDKLESTYGKERLQAFERHPENVPGDFMHVSLNATLVCTGKPPLPGMEPKSPVQPSAPTPQPLGEVGGPVDGSRDYTEFGTGEVQLAPGALEYPETVAPAETQRDH